VRVGRVLRGPRADVCAFLEVHRRRYSAAGVAFGALLAEGRGCFPAVAHLLGYDAIHFSAGNPAGPELVDVQPPALFTAPCHLRYRSLHEKVQHCSPGSRGGCGVRAVGRTGARQPCACDAAQRVLNCAPGPSTALGDA
jgi:hypothetical protein